MRRAVVILVIIGTIASIGLGAKWLSDFNTYETEIAAIASVEELKADPVMAEAFKEMEAVRNCAYALIVCGVIAVVSVFLIGKIGKIAAGIILACAIIPAIFSPISLVVTFFFVIGGILAFLTKPKVQDVKAA